MKYLIVQDWQSTHGNHAGMVHMCKLLKEKWPDEYEVYIKPQPRTYKKVEGSGFVARSLRWIKTRMVIYYQDVVYPREYKKLCAPMFEKLKPGDEVFLLEYLIPWCSQYQLACYLRRNFSFIKIFALSHLTVKYFKESPSLLKNNIINRWAAPIDKMLTLGTSLSNYFQICGIEKNKISTGFHYVDHNYYFKKTLNFEMARNTLTIIAMGALQRDYPLLADVVVQCPDVHWVICRGRNNIDDMFPKSDNIELKGYLSEDELRDQMDRADVSLNIMEDTVGSNVITTSMSMGLAMIVTDVGSIRDYCDDSNALFCQNNVSDIVEAVKYLKSNKNKLLVMRKNSIEKSRSLAIENVHVWFSSL